MVNKKVLKKWVSGSEYRTKKISEFGLRSLFKKGKPILPYFKSFFQKSSEPYSFRSMPFDPKDYSSQDPLERKGMAYEDAKNHLKIYNKAIKEKIYPTGTKARVKRAKHSNCYIIEMTMPNVKRFDRVYRSSLVPMRPGLSPDREEADGLESERAGVQCRIGSIIENSGVKNDADPKRPYFDEDLGEQFNYGIDRDGRVVYIDQHILRRKLPFEGRTEYSKLERSVAGVIIGFFLISLLFFLNGFTGLAISNLNSPNSNIIGVIFFIIGLFITFLMFKNKEFTKF